MVVSGAVVSTTKARWAAVPSWLPARSVARTAKLCCPSVRTSVVKSYPQASKSPSSTWHSNVEPAWLEW